MPSLHCPTVSSTSFLSSCGFRRRGDWYSVRTRSFLLLVSYIRVITPPWMPMSSSGLTRYLEQTSLLYASPSSLSNCNGSVTSRSVQFERRRCSRDNDLHDEAPRFGRTS